MKNACISWVTDFLFAFVIFHVPGDFFSHIFFTLHLPFFLSRQAWQSVYSIEIKDVSFSTSQEKYCRLIFFILYVLSVMKQWKEKSTDDKILGKNKHCKENIPTFRREKWFPVLKLWSSSHENVGWEKSLNIYFTIFCEIRIKPQDCIGSISYIILKIKLDSLKVST